MNKWIIGIFIFGAVYVAYTGIDVTDQYDDFTDIRDKALHLGDPVVKDGLKRISNSNFDVVVDKAVEEIVDGHHE